MTIRSQKTSGAHKRPNWLVWFLVGAVVFPTLAFGSRAIIRARTTKSSTSAVDSARKKPELDLRTSLDDSQRRGGSAEATRSSPTPRLLDVAQSSGVNFTFYPDTVPGRFFLPENMGGGAGWIDVDGDGMLDLLLTNGCRLPVKSTDTLHVQHLFRQTSRGQFEDIGELAGIALTFYAQGCAVGDLDNDGFSDVVLGAYGNVLVFSNNGDGTFRSDQGRPRIDDPGWSTSVALGDVNRDGALDVYLAHYALVSLDEIPVCMYDGTDGKVRGYCGPSNYVAEPHGFFLNQSDGTFARFEFTGDAAPTHPGKGLGVVIADLDNDDWPEIYVANDMDPSFLFHNLGNEPAQQPRFEEVAMAAGAAVSVDGMPEAGMGVACADFSGEQRLDLFVTHYYMQKNTFYQNHGGMLFSDRSSAVGLAVPSLPFLGFGTVPLDYDLDGWQDLFVANGHVLGKAILPYAMRAQLFRNTGKAQFVEMTGRAGAYFFDERVSRGVAMADFDNDGDDDLVIVHLNDQPVTLLRNDSDRVGQPLGIELLGTKSPRSGTGARLLVRTGDHTLMRMALGGGSYLSASDQRILVGVAKNTSSASVEVHWPSGEIETWPDLKPGQYWRLVEGTSTQSPPRSQMITPRR